jgi:hypothetical protein
VTKDDDSADAMIKYLQLERELLLQDLIEARRSLVKSCSAPEAPLTPTTAHSAQHSSTATATDSYIKQEDCSREAQNQTTVTDPHSVKDWAFMLSGTKPDSSVQNRPIVQAQYAPYGTFCNMNGYSNQLPGTNAMGFPLGNSWSYQQPYGYFQSPLQGYAQFQSPIQRDDTVNYLPEERPSACFIKTRRCAAFERGSFCAYSDDACRYSHNMRKRENVRCIDFDENQKCSRGKQCFFRHVAKNSEGKNVMY